MLFFERFCILCDRDSIAPTTLLKNMGLTKSHFTSWRNGTVPNAVILQMLADHFQVSVDYLLGRTDFASYIPKNDHPEDQDGQKILNKLIELDQLLSTAEFSALSIAESLEGFKQLQDYIRFVLKKEQ